MPTGFFYKRTFCKADCPPNMRRILATYLQALAVTVVAFALGCTKPQTAKVSVPQPPKLPPISSSPPLTQVAKLSPTEESLHEIGSEMEGLISQPTFSVPDAVLNRTACLVVFPSNSENGESVEGFASCRNSAGQWTSPVVANLVSATNARPHLDLFILVLSDRARHQLVSGHLDLRSRLRVAAGPMSGRAAILDQVGASRDIFAYVLGDRGLRGAIPPKAAIALNSAQTQRLYGHSLDTTQLLADGTMSSTVTSFYRVDVASFFNTIIPAGIIIHHSVLIPAGDLPETERTLDRFHYARGYEVSCFGKVYHIAYHYLILPDGKVISGRPERCEGAHARGYNSYLGIALVGDFSSHDKSHRTAPARPTKAQLASLIRLCCYLRQKYSIPLQRIMPHNAVSRTECPGEGLEFNTILAAVSRESGAGS